MTTVSVQSIASKFCVFKDGGPIKFGIKTFCPRQQPPTASDDYTTSDQCSLFILNNRISEKGITIRLNVVIVTYERHPKYLSVELDRKPTLNQHINILIEKTSTRQ
jgi:hypothetical protein